MKVELIKLYEYFVQKIYPEGYDFFELNPTPAHKKVLVNWLVELAKDIDLEMVDFNYLFDYVGFTFEYILIKRPNYNSRRIPLNQIFSSTSYERWKGRNKGYEYYVGENLYKRGVRREDLDPNQYNLISITELDDDEEAFKKRYGELGLCLESTSLFNHKSSHCMECKDKDACKKLLSQISPAVYYDRGYV